MGNIPYQVTIRPTAATDIFDQRVRSFNIKGDRWNEVVEEILNRFEAVSIHSLRVENTATGESYIYDNTGKRTKRRELFE